MPPAGQPRLGRKLVRVRFALQVFPARINGRAVLRKLRRKTNSSKSLD